MSKFFSFAQYTGGGKNKLQVSLVLQKFLKEGDQVIITSIELEGQTAKTRVSLPHVAQVFFSPEPKDDVVRSLVAKHRDPCAQGTWIGGRHL